MVDVVVGEGRPGHGKVLVVGMDGVRFDRLPLPRPPGGGTPESLRPPSTAPVLHGLMAAGAHGSGLLPYGEVDGQAEGGPSTSMAYTDSGPGWSSVLTGVWPDRHGVTGNDFTGADYSRYPDFLSRAVTARPALRTAAVVSWPELVHRGTLGPAIGQRVPYDGESDGYESADRLVAGTALRWLTEDDPDVVFVYFGATDEAGHATGPLGPAYDRALLAQDAHLGRLLDAVGSRRSDPVRADEHWTVLVTTDHGHLDTGGHGGDTRAEREVFVVLAEPGTPGGTRLATPRLVDIAPTVLDRLGIPVDPAWGLQGRVLPRPAASPLPPATSERS
ncbi:alkaline phosphatase family protein [Streptomyces europaeiscabiei]|uniref:Alkaline phosphatase family protein n=2 Tax=Streptomyces europaeiscabiei TaxID=146819 RepID=A0ABU4N5A2_9ACTN|nr:alkaline phosphatase family protein [Streptomyces europaeiscabiei]MDX2527128.1 alkaline phosphatase family protein [Streptomyces europaeiscabiei]MDX3542186.1 alkaline phosphatase family protein [Streptomyces europaeiscabiei]MDX3551234.1 alkaline phosphatase family protein [Streptomyces europaeiscabiei]MDX3698206.1 alkaline phosphatase family protein [Streptomyces europaeiscabiei]MDX3707409.1 alkaline phosphatase family protein [Streptomyces europaeiscabiei]